MLLCLYFCRNLADVSNDNLMNVSEFIVALHLINGVLGGKQVPKVLPENLEVPSQEEVPIEVPSVSEREAYNTVFQKCDQSGKGLINGEISDKSLFFNLKNWEYWTFLSEIQTLLAVSDTFYTSTCVKMSYQFNLWQVTFIRIYF